MTLARWLPPNLTSKFGLVVGTVLRTFGPITFSSVGVNKVGSVVYSGLSGYVGGGTSIDDGEASRGEEDTPELELAKFKFRNSQRPAHRRLYGKYFYGKKCITLAQDFILAEGTDVRLSFVS